MLTIDDIITSSGKYPDRAKHQTAGVARINADILIKRVNAFLNELGWQQPVVVSSGFRTPEANAAAGGAKRSLHQMGLAVDIADPKQELGKAIRANGGALLRKHGLFMEALEHSPTWTHLDCSPMRQDRPNREFTP